jgi:hypothetical protein
MPAGYGIILTQIKALARRVMLLRGQICAHIEALVIAGSGQA